MNLKKTSVDYFELKNYAIHSLQHLDYNEQNWFELGEVLINSAYPVINRNKPYLAIRIIYDEVKNRDFIYEQKITQ